MSAVVMEPELQKCLVTFESPDGMFFLTPFNSSVVLFRPSITINIEKLIDMIDTSVACY